MANIEEPMLDKVYYRDCPGCRMDQLKETRRGIPYKEFTYKISNTSSTFATARAHATKRHSFHHEVGSRFSAPDIVLLALLHPIRNLEKIRAICRGGDIGNQQLPAITGGFAGKTDEKRKESRWGREREKEGRRKFGVEGMVGGCRKRRR
ncbi:hypothetical protein Syun_011812 [Stephania yunnanensis]|uniref:Uncharacterized protein n=1 Tax=Stephania yunnanensis TaxID=152371 RepID=A0AAP0JYG2_9MAGN